MINGHNRFLVGKSISPQQTVTAYHNESKKVQRWHFSVLDTAFAKNKDDGKWYYFDDSSVSIACEDQIVASTLCFAKIETVGVTNLREFKWANHEPGSRFAYTSLSRSKGLYQRKIFFSNMLE